MFLAGLGVVNCMFLLILFLVNIIFICYVQPFNSRRTERRSQTLQLAQACLLQVFGACALAEFQYVFALPPLLQARFGVGERCFEKVQS